MFAEQMKQVATFIVLFMVFWPPLWLLGTRIGTGRWPRFPMWKLLRWHGKDKPEPDDLKPLVPYTEGMTLAPGQITALPVIRLDELVQDPVLRGEIERGEKSIQAVPGPAVEWGKDKFYIDVNVMVGGQPYAKITVQWEQ